MTMFVRHTVIGCLIALASYPSAFALAQATTPALAPAAAPERALEPSPGPVPSNGTERAEPSTTQPPSPEAPPSAAADPANATGVPPVSAAAPEQATSPAADSVPPSAAEQPHEPQSSEAVEPPSADKLRTLASRSTETQQRIEQLIAERNRVRLTGLRVARSVTWTAASAFALGSLLSFAAAEDVERDLKASNHAGANDKDLDGDVDGDDERHARRVSRTMGGASLIMAAGGVLSSVFYRRQLHEMNELTSEIESLRGQQKRAIFELDYELRASKQEARVGLIVRM